MSKKHPLLIYIAIIFASILSINCAPKISTAEKQLSEHLTNSVLWYQRSAEMTASYLQAYQYAEYLLSNKLDTMEFQKPPAVVLDIDETVLDNSPYEAQLIEEGKTYASESWKKWTDEVRAEVLPGAKEFLTYAKENGVEVFYISNRKQTELESTIQNLTMLDLPNADQNHIFLKSGTSDKTERRQHVANDYTIILFVGDNLTDYSQLYADRGKDMGKNILLKNKEELLDNFIILPNPMYGEWEGSIYGNDYGISNEEKIIRRKKAFKK
ncbi:5'-nucleotidase, lipoprotein e(P4) family [Fulvivirga sediminis]|uniref:5'-nucleotidase, lipoprotein e(P4) family n=1 Tax=Fulvivirga sediminis TaxID=2803949 RepID=A0A937F4Z1_9BACT|nr:5'-nucleotidase, lipoprotein e(P4) family [Fulvivirga sediminis]MBL3654779.1 5'-nucleotidase, lipoprotein e(P4) family [Fulvivirga sediminis]